MHYYSTIVYINNTSSRDKIEFLKRQLKLTHKAGLLKYENPSKMTKTLSKSLQKITNWLKHE